MLKIIFTVIILYIIITHYFEDPIVNNVVKEKLTNTNQTNEVTTVALAPVSVKVRDVIEAPPVQTPQSIKQQRTNEVGQNKSMEFDRPNPWSRIIVDETAEFPYNFMIKLKIPSLNDYENWKQIIPNLDFSAQSGELVIPSKDEASALAVANLISVNFLGQLSLKDILDKNLIQISIAKAQNYEIVQTKLREQIITNLYGNKATTTQTTFEKDLARSGASDSYSTGSRSSGPVDFQSETFTDTFQHFGSNNNRAGVNEIEAYTGNDYSYL